MALVLGYLFQRTRKRVGLAVLLMEALVPLLYILLPFAQRWPINLATNVWWASSTVLSSEKTGLGGKRQAPRYK